MSDGAGVGDSTEPGEGYQRTGGAAEPATGGGSPLSRRRFLQAAAAGGVAVGLASLGYWQVESAVRPRATAPPTPKPSFPAGALTYRSRPDLFSPIISVAAPGYPAAPGRVLLTPAAGPGPIVVDDAGEAVWIHPAPAGKRTFNLRVGSYRGAPVLTWWEGNLIGGTGQGEYVLVDESYAEVARVRAGNGLAGDLHEFITTPEGTALFTVYAQRPNPEATPGASSTPGVSVATASPLQPPGVSVSGSPGASSAASSAASPSSPPGAILLESIVQEVDLATGRLLFEWRSADHVSPKESYVGPSGGQPFDYFHVNSIDVDTDGNLLISARHTWAVYKIDRHTGQVIWRLGGKMSDFQMGPGTQFAWQHDARRQPDGSLTLFDDGSNGSKPPTEVFSRGLVLDLNESLHKATLRQAYAHPGGILAMSQGSMQALSNGNVLVGWGDQPWFTEFAADGSLVLDGRLPDGSTSYRAVRYLWRGRPADAPAIATAHGDPGSTTVFASWNGSTEVASWVVLGGDSPDGLAEIGSGPRSGFETSIDVPGRPSVVVVKALDSSGAVLAQSSPIGA